MPIDSHVEKDPQWFNEIFARATAGTEVAPNPPSLQDTVIHKPPVEETTTETPVEEKPVAPLEIDKLLFSPDKEETTTSEENVDTDLETELQLTPDEFKTELIKSTIQKLIEDGKWAEVEGLDELEFNEDTFLKISELQAQHAAEQYVEQVAQQNEIISGIFEAHRNGVDLDTVLDLFKEQKSIADIDTSTPEGKIEKIKRYLEDVEELPRETVKKKLRLLDADSDALDTEFEIVESKFQTHFQNQQQRLIKEQQQEQERKTKERNAQIYARFNVLKESGIKENDAKTLLANVYTDNLKLRDGTAISQFDYRLMQMQEDPKKHLELIQFVLDPDKYKKQLMQQAANTATEKVARKISVIPQRTATTTTQPNVKTKSDFPQQLLNSL